MSFPCVYLDSADYMGFPTRNNVGKKWRDSKRHLHEGGISCGSLGLSCLLKLRLGAGK